MLVAPSSTGAAAGTGHGKAPAMGALESRTADVLRRLQLNSISIGATLAEGVAVPDELAAADAAAGLAGLAGVLRQWIKHERKDAFWSFLFSSAGEIFGGDDAGDEAAATLAATKPHRAILGLFMAVMEAKPADGMPTACKALAAQVRSKQQQQQQQEPI